MHNGRMKKAALKKPTDTRERLLETAIQLIWQSNYSNVGVNEICEKAGITKGAFYHYFDSKATLFEQATQYHWEHMKAEIDSVFSPERTPLEQHEGLFGFILAKQDANQYDDNPVSGCPFFTSGAQVGPDEEKIRTTCVEMSEKAVRYDTALVKNLASEGFLEQHVDPRQTAEMLYQYIQGLLLYGRVFRDRAVVERNMREGAYRILGLKQEYRK